MAKKFRRLRTAAVLTITVAVTAMLILGVMAFIGSFQQSLYEERAHHLDETAAQITATIDETLESQWSQLELVSLYVEQHGELNSAELAEGLKRMENQLNLEGLALSVADDKGTYLHSDGSEYRIYQTDILNADKPERQILIGQANIMDASERMMFFLRLDTPVELADGRRITHVVANRKMSVFGEIFRSDAYDGKNAVFILDNRGSKIYQDTELRSFLNSQNVLKALEMAKIQNGDSIETIQNNMVQGKSSVAFIEEDGQSYFVTVQSMAYSDWNVLMVVPEEYVSVQTSDFAGNILRTTVLLAAFIFTSILTAVLLWVRSRSQSRLLEQEQKSNEAYAFAAAEATRANKVKSEFLSHMSHDVRTPINGIIGMLNIAERNIDDIEVVKDCYGKIRTVSNHLLNLINDILDVSKLEAGKIEFRNEPFSMRALLDSCCSVIQGKAEDEGLAFTADFSGVTHDAVTGSELHVRQVLINILGNAVKYTKEGSIRFTVKELSNDEKTARYQFVVADTGIGMSEEFQKQVFEPFVQEDGGARTTYTGTGLGMAIVKKIVDQLGGTIAVKSELGAGSTFCVELSFPIADELPEPSGEETDDETPADISGMHVLLVDDNEMNIEIGLMFLEEAGATADTARDGKEAVEKFLASEPGQYDVILMDVLMPEMDGLEAARTIRQSSHPDAQTIPIFAQTANAFAEDVAAAKAAGMNGHIAKPIDEKQMLRLIAQYRNRGEESKEQ